MWTSTGYKYSWRKMEGRQHKTELDGDKLPVAYVPPGATRHNITGKSYNGT